MSTPVIDFHCHLDLYPKPEQLVSRYKMSSVYMLSVTTTPKAWRGTFKLALGNSKIKTALGLHPQIAHERLNELPLFDALLPETRYIGEVGLDGSPGFKSFWREQGKAFDHVLAASARSGGRIISVHSRRAATDVLNYLERYPDAGIPVLHWFSGTKLELLRAIDMGCWFSVGPGMLLGKRSRELVSLIPRDRILTETDGPFVEDNGRRLMPGELEKAHEALANCWKVSSNEVVELVFSSFEKLISFEVGGAESIHS